MSVSKIATRYAKSLLDLANDQGILEEVRNDVSVFSEMVKHRELALLLKSPIINIGKKKSIFKALFEERFQKLTNAFLNIVLVKGREAYLIDIAREFQVQYKVYKGITSVKITSAAPLDEANLEKIKSTLLKSTETAQNLDIVLAVDPALIGGFILEIGDKLYDNSIAHKLNNLQKDFSGNDYVKSF